MRVLEGGIGGGGGVARGGGAARGSDGAGDGGGAALGGFGDGVMTVDAAPLGLEALGEALGEALEVALGARAAVAWCCVGVSAAGLRLASLPGLGGCCGAGCCCTPARDGAEVPSMKTQTLTGDPDAVGNFEGAGGDDAGCLSPRAL